MNLFDRFPCAGRYAGTPVRSRRQMLAESAAGLGGIALAWLGANAARAAAPPAYDLAPKKPHFPATAKRVILLYMGGGPSQMDLLDPKPVLTKYDGRPIPFGVEQRGLAHTTKCMASPFRFARHGRCGHEMSELLPHLAAVADDIAVVRSGVSNRIDHGEALLVMHTGRPLVGFPTVGSWVTYGLGTENANLPAYVAIANGVTAERVRPGTSCGCLPALYQGTPLNTDAGAPFPYLQPPAAAPIAERNPAQFQKLTQALNRRHLADRPGTSELDARIQNFELAARMQAESLRSLDLSGETEATRKLYGLDNPQTAEFGKRCLLARRLVEAGVRFVHLMRFDWDHHAQLRQKLPKSCAETDQPVAALLKDLKQRGLLADTLVVWMGEFGRLPIVEGADGRDHNPHGFSYWLAGGGVKGGAVVGATDEFGYKSVESPVSMADLHATILHLLGLRHDKLTFEFEGRDETLTGVERARVVKELLA